MSLQLLKRGEEEIQKHFRAQWEIHQTQILLNSSTSLASVLIDNSLRPQLFCILFDLKCWKRKPSWVIPSIPECNWRCGPNSKPHICMCINIHRNFISLADFKSFSPRAWRVSERLLKPYKSPGLKNLTFHHLSAYNTIFNSGFNENFPSGSIHCQKTRISFCVLTAEKRRRKQMARIESEICETVRRWQVEIHPE